MHVCIRKIIINENTRTEFEVVNSDSFILNINQSYVGGVNMENLWNWAVLNISNKLILIAYMSKTANFNILNLCSFLPHNVIKLRKSKPHRTLLWYLSCQQLLLDNKLALHNKKHMKENIKMDSITINRLKGDFKNIAILFM